MSINGIGVSNSGALVSTAGTNSLLGAVTLTGNSTVKVDTDSLTLFGQISGAGMTLTKTGAGTLNLDGTQNYDALTVSAGTLNVNGTLGTLPGLAVVTASNAGTHLRFGSVSQTLSSLSIGAGARVTFTSGTASSSFGGSGKDAVIDESSAVVPEPGTIGLLLVGALGLSGCRGRRRG